MCVTLCSKEVALSFTHTSMGAQEDHRAVPNEALYGTFRKTCLQLGTTWMLRHSWCLKLSTLGCFRCPGRSKQYLFQTHRLAVLMSSLSTSLASITWIHVSIRQVRVRRSISVSHKMARLPVRSSRVEAL